MGKEYIQRRNSLRLQGYDYSQEGAYYITIVTADRQKTLGDIQGETTQLSLAGNVIDAEWQKLPDRFPGVELDAFVVMPNHVHGIILLSEERNSEKNGSISVSHNKANLSMIIGSYKSVTSRIIRRFHFLRTNEIWHRGFHDHIIRSVEDYERIREYILNNPAHWPSDEEYW
jgi:putative transposase